MKALEWAVCLGTCCLVSAQAPPVQAVRDEPRLGLVEGLDRMRVLHGEQQDGAAYLLGKTLLSPGSFSAWRRELEQAGTSWLLPLLDLADPLLDALRLSGLTREQRAHVHFALGVVAQDLPETPDQSDAPAKSEVAQFEFNESSTGAGVGSLREDATYNLGTLAFAQGEDWRAQMPEFGGTPPAPTNAAPTAPTVPGSQPASPPEPLKEARKHYLEAKRSFSLRLRMDWQDGDSRANTELVMRRLRELDKIERQREKQKQEQLDKDKDKDKQDKQDKQDKGKQDQDKQNQDQQDKDKQDQEDQQSKDKQKPEEKPQEQPPSEAEQDPKEQDAKPGEEQQPQEIYLTKEQVQRLLERLKEHEEQGEELRERRRAQRRPTARDW